MRDSSDYYECIIVHAGNLLIASNKLERIVSTLLNDYKFRLKGTGSIKYYLGCDFFRDEN